MRTYPLHGAPVGLLTSAQLHARGLRPGPQKPIAQARCVRGRRTVAVPLYDLTASRPEYPVARAARTAWRLFGKTLAAAGASTVEVPR